MNIFVRRQNILQYPEHGNPGLKNINKKRILQIVIKFIWCKQVILFPPFSTRPNSVLAGRLVGMYICFINYRDQATVGQFDVKKSNFFPFLTRPSSVYWQVGWGLCTYVFYKL